MTHENGSVEQQILQVDESTAIKGTADSQIVPADPLIAATSLEDTGQTKRPRDARLLHIILASLGVQAYQERVPLQLMDFAYRYTSSVLQDTIHLSSEAYGTTGGAGSKNSSANDLSSVTLQSLRLAVASRQHYQFQSNLPKEHFQELAVEKNKVALPTVGKGSHVRLPPERYCLTGVGYGLREEWEDDIEGKVAGARVSGPDGTARINGGSGDESLMQVDKVEKIAGSDDEEMKDG